MKLRSSFFPKGTIVWACIGLIQYIRWRTSVGVHRASAGAHLACLVNFVPAILFTMHWVIYGVLYWLAPKKVGPPERVGIFQVLGLFSIQVLLLITVWVEIFLIGITPITSRRKYTKILNEHRSYPYHNEILSHFPRKIPVKATDVRFSYLPQIMQGGGHLQIAYKLPSVEVEALYERFSKRKTRSFPDKSDRESQMPTAFYTSGTSESSFPEGFEVMTLDDSFESKSTHNDNHGISHGVAIHRANHQIVYWAEWW